MTGRGSRRRSRFSFGLACLLSGLVACTASDTPLTSFVTTHVVTTATTSIPDGSDTASGETANADIGELVRGTVQVLLVSNGVTIGWGSGTIISPDGLILTNAHVAAPAAPGLAVGGRAPDALVIALVEREDQPPVPSYLAEVLTAEGYLDLAILRITATIDGDPVEPADLELSHVDLGDSDSILLGDALIVLGFPGIGGDTVSLTTGRVAGFLADDRVGPRAWVKTDTDIAQGNSGGLAADEGGRIVGVPTEVYVGSDFGEQGRLRPIDLAKPLIDDARAGERYVRDSTTVPGGGSEQLVFRTWTTDVDAAGCPVDSVDAYPSGATSMVASFEWTGMTDRQEIRFDWILDSGSPLYSDSFTWEEGPAGECAWFGLHNGGTPLPNGTYDLIVSTQTTSIGQATTRVGHARAIGGAIVGGRIVDLDTGSGIPGAVIYVLHPGVDVESWFSSDRDFAQVFTNAQTDPQGRYLLPGALEPGISYAAMVEAGGYEPLWGEIVIEPGAASPVELEDISLVRR